MKKRREFLILFLTIPLMLVVEFLRRLLIGSTDEIHYESSQENSMAPITNLYSRVVYYAGRTNQPIVCLIHGYGGVGAADFALIDLKRIAINGVFVVAPGMRGWDGADGAKDASGRETYDLYDCIEYVKAHYPGVVNQNNIAVVGYSGGGADALGFACKFPDYASVVVDHFGISDYGVDGTNGWWQKGDAARKAVLEAEIGDTPAAVPNNYRSRYAPDGIINFTGGHLFIIHDPTDTIVEQHQSIDITNAMDGSSLTNYTANYSTDWDHGYPTDAGTLKNSEYLWIPSVLAGTYPAWTIPASGTIKVLGYIKTKRFTIWLDSGQTSSATVVYDTAAHTYTVTPITTANISVSITEGALTASGTANAGESTLFTAV
jgi:pimeloyl-ACP methyl ester carboxylesterase